ncbi:MAG TPA: hypothetical protein DCG25_02325, partial [Acidimicrobiaceae bacterium]|nr:hypothetical protein [Acidimicrobiaceae bacterium]
LGFDRRGTTQAVFDFSIPEGVTMTIDRIFEGYRSWFQETYLRQLAEENEEDIADLEWSDPFADLHPLSA